MKNPASAEPESLMNFRRERGAGETFFIVIEDRLILSDFSYDSP